MAIFLIVVLFGGLVFSLYFSLFGCFDSIRFLSVAGKGSVRVDFVFFFEI